GQPIAGLPDRRGRSLGLGVVGKRVRRRWRWDRSGLQDGLDGGETGHLGKQAVGLDFAGNRARANQTDLTMVESLAHGNHNRASLLGVGLGRGERAARTLVETLPALTTEAKPPFAQPLAFAGDTFANLARSFTFETQAYRLTSPA